MKSSFLPFLVCINRGRYIQLSFNSISQRRSLKIIENMKIHFVLFTVSVLVLFASTIDARKDLEEYWRSVMKEQPIPESIQDLLSVNSAISTTNANENADNVQPSDDQKSFAKNFDPKPNFLFYSAYKGQEQPIPESIQDVLPVDSIISTTNENGDNVQPSDVQKSLAKNFDPKPNFLFYSAYKGKNQPSEVTSFANDFKPKPNFLFYDRYNGQNQPSEMKSLAKNFNPKPNFLFYTNYKGQNQPSEVKSFAKNFNPQPNFLFYTNYKGQNQPSEMKSVDNDELKPNSQVAADA